MGPVVPALSDWLVVCVCVCVCVSISYKSYEE